MMGGTDVTTSLSSQIQAILPLTKDAYYKLILAVGPVRAGKTAAFMDLLTKHEWPRVNVNLCLSERLLELTYRQRAVRGAVILDDMLSNAKSNVVLLDNIELLFAAELAQDPLKLLQSLSRNRTIIAAWPGDFDGDTLTYAEPGHPEARRYPNPQAVIIKTGEYHHSDIRSPREKMA
jgi:hypothetical protein